MKCQIKFLYTLFIAVIIGLTYCLWEFVVNNDYKMFILLALIPNSVCVWWLTHYVIRNFLFPFGCWYTKFAYHKTMNAKMCREIRITSYKVLDSIQKMQGQTFFKNPISNPICKEGPRQFEKLIDYLELFTTINGELIESDKSKKKRGKKTRRYPISSTFIEFTDTMNQILTLLKQIKIVSITEFHAGDDSDDQNSQDGGDFCPEKDQSLLQLRSIYEHFKTLSKTK